MNPSPKKLFGTYGTSYLLSKGQPNEDAQPFWGVRPCQSESEHSEPLGAHQLSRGVLSTDFEELPQTEPDRPAPLALVPFGLPRFGCRVELVPSLL